MKAKPAKPPQHSREASQYPCLCALIRKAGRIVTRKYDRYLKPAGLKITQFSLLTNIARNPNLKVTDLAKLMMMNQTTVTRNLRVLQKSGYIHLTPEATDQRIKRIRVSDLGMARLAQARPCWEQAQEEMEGIFGGGGIDKLMASLQKIAG